MLAKELGENGAPLEDGCSSHSIGLLQNVLLRN